MSEIPKNRRGKALIGVPSVPWDPTQWTAVDDRVRGGASQSHFSVSDNATGHFSGNLDITALGGAGFASQKLTFPSPNDLSAWAGMMINIAGGNDQKYTLVLKDGEELPKRSDGRMQSTVSWEFDFVVKDGPVQYMPFEDFKPTYRGRRMEAPERAFDPAGIRSISVMLKSHFGEQTGEMDLSLRWIGVYQDGCGCTCNQ